MNDDKWFIPRTINLSINELVHNKDVEGLKLLRDKLGNAIVRINKELDKLDSERKQKPK